MYRGSRKNGDRITAEVIGLARGKLDFSAAWYKEAAARNAVVQIPRAADVTMRAP